MGATGMIRLRQLSDTEWSLAEGGVETHGLSRAELVRRVVALVGADGPMHPAAAALVKIGSLARHAQEIVAQYDAHEPAQEVDLAAVRALLTDPEVVEWMDAMDALALLPVMR